MLGSMTGMNSNSSILQKAASAQAKLPEEDSITVVPGPTSPRWIAPFRIQNAGRSFTLPMPFRYSSLANKSIRSSRNGITGVSRMIFSADASRSTSFRPECIASILDSPIPEPGRRLGCGGTREIRLEPAQQFGGVVPAHGKQRQRVIGGGKRRLLNSGVGTQPVPWRKPAIAKIAQAGAQVPVFHHPLSAWLRGVVRHGLARPIEIQGPGDIQPVGAHEKTEGATDSRIHIQHLVLPIARIVTIADIENALVADGLHEMARQPVHGWIGRDNSQAGGPGVDGTLAQLLAGNAEPAFRLGVEITVEHPDGIRASRNVLLKHQVGRAGILQAIVPVEEFGRALDDHLRNQPAPPQAAVVVRLEHHGKGSAAEVIENVLAGLRQKQVRRGHARVPGEKMHLLLPIERADQARAVVLDKESFAKGFGIVGRQDCHGIGGGNQDGRATMPKPFANDSLSRTTARAWSARS